MSTARADFGFKFMNAAHRVVLRLSGGHLLSNPFGMPAVELHTIGAKTGLPRATMLTSPVHDAERVVLVASKGGADRNPLWLGNLVAHPEVELTIKGVTTKMLARVASPAELRDAVLDVALELADASHADAGHAGNAAVPAEAGARATG